MAKLVKEPYRRKAITIDKWKPMANLYKLHKTANNVLVPWSIFVCRSFPLRAIATIAVFFLWRELREICHNLGHIRIAAATDTL